MNPMAKATRLHSRKRRTAPKIKPAAPANAFDNASRNEALARAFIALEPDICNLDRMTRLCLHLSDDGADAEEYLTLCLEQMAEMAVEFRKQYYALYGRRDSAGADSKAVLS
jgi:hypothetical protein